MQFSVGPFRYRLLIADKSIFDAEGNELEGCALESRRLIIISRIVEPDRREEVALHEVYHCWQFHVPAPRTEEESATFSATVAQQFHADIESQGGREALKTMQLSRVPMLGRPVPAQAPSSAPREIFGGMDRVPCACCGADVMCGSIHTSEATLHESTGKYRVERWFRCEACGSVQTWQEIASPDGTPLGEYVANPRPQLLQGAEAMRWVAERAEVAA